VSELQFLTFIIFSPHKKVFLALNFLAFMLVRRILAAATPNRPVTARQGARRIGRPKSCPTR
jgi:hypothetical protein